MNKLFSYILILLYCANCQAASIDIIETTELKPIAQEIDRSPTDSLVIFDVKFVLFAPEDQLFALQNKAKLREIKAQLKAKYPPEVTEELLSIITKQQKIGSVDPGMARFIQSLQQRGTKVIALTSGITGKYGVIDSREDLRIKNLNNLGIDLANSFPGVEPIIFSDIKGATQNEPPMYKDGVIFTSRLPKGEILAKFLASVSYKPKKIIFIDNQRKKLESVQNYCRNNNIDFQGFHYVKFLKTEPAPYNERLIERQVEILETKKQWLSDREASVKL